MIIEDSAHLVNSLRILLPRKGYEVTNFCTDLDEARTALASGTSDILLLDLSLKSPGDGFGILAIQDELGLDIPVIVITGAAREEAEGHSDPRIRAIVYKPFPIDQLVNELDRVVGG